MHNRNGEQRGFFTRQMPCTKFSNSPPVRPRIMCICPSARKGTSQNHNRAHWCTYTSVLQPFAYGLFQLC